MPYTFEFEYDDENYQEGLRQFVISTRELLHELLHNADYTHFLEEELLGDIYAAWDELQPRFGVLIETIPQIPPETIEKHGLRNRSLRLKINLVRHWVRRFLRGANGAFMIRVLDSVDVLLDSLISASGAGTAISEFKEALKNAISFPEDQQMPPPIDDRIY